MIYDLLTFILACYGMTMIVVYGKIFDKVRPDWEVLKCTMCTGFWVGCLLSICLDTEFGLLIGGFISSGTTYLLSKIVDDEGIVVKINKG